MTTPASPGGALFPATVHVPDVPDRRGSLLLSVSSLLLVVAGGLAIGGSFGKLEEEAERAGDQTLTLTFTSWRLTQGGSYSNRIYFFHAPHFGIPLVATGVLTIVSGLLLVLGRGRLGALARPAALASAGLLVGTVWTLSLVVSANLDAVTKSEDFELDWTSGIGFWLILTGGIAAVLGGLAALFSGIPRMPADPPTPRYGFPSVMFVPPGQPMPRATFAAPPHMAGMSPDSGPLGPTSAPFIPQPAQQVDPLTGHPVGPVLPVFQPPTPPVDQPPDR